MARVTTDSTTQDLDSACPKCAAAIDPGVVVKVDPAPFVGVTAGADEWFAAVASIEACFKWLAWMALADWYEALMVYSYQMAIGLAVWRGLRNCAPETWWRYKNVPARENLQVDLAQWELAEAATSMAKLEGELRATQAEKREVAKDFKEREDSLMERIHNISLRIRNGQERFVDVTVTYDYRLGLRVKTRNDTGEIIEERPLTGEERQQDFTVN